MANRNKLLELFISNLANAITHNILEKAIDDSEVSEKYNKEIKNSREIAKKYREKINPVNKSLPSKDIEKIKRKVTNKIKSELRVRIEKGYENIDFSLVEEFVEKSLSEMKVK